MRRKVISEDDQISRAYSDGFSSSLPESISFLFLVKKYVPFRKLIPQPITSPFPYSSRFFAKEFVPCGEKAINETKKNNILLRKCLRERFHHRRRDNQPRTNNHSSQPEKSILQKHLEKVHSHEERYLLFEIWKSIIGDSHCQSFSSLGLQHTDGDLISTFFLSHFFSKSVTSFRSMQ